MPKIRVSTLAAAIIWAIVTICCRCQVFAQPLPTDSTSPQIDVDSVANAMPDSTGVKPRTIRNITPVDVDDNKPLVVMHYYDKHGDPLKEPVLLLAALDTVQKPKSKPIYPCFSGISIGADFGDGVLMLAGQKYSSYGVWADVSLWNWLFPVVEAGVGFADRQPKNSDFRYKGKLSPYTKLGFNYNFLYKSNPDYRFHLGLRVGWSSFRYDADDYATDNDKGYLSLTNQKGSAVWGEILGGIRVKIAGNFSMGWDVRYHYKFHVKSESAFQPWFIPGYGADSPIAFSLSAIWNLPYGRPSPAPAAN